MMEGAHDVAWRDPALLEVNAGIQARGDQLGGGPQASGRGARATTEGVRSAHDPR